MSEQPAAKSFLHDLPVYGKLQTALDNQFDALNIKQEFLFKAEFLRCLPPEGPLFAFTVPAVNYLLIKCDIRNQREHNTAFHELLSKLRDTVGKEHIQFAIYPSTACALISFDRHFIIRWEVSPDARATVLLLDFK